MALPGLQRSAYTRAPRQKPRATPRQNTQRKRRVRLVLPRFQRAASWVCLGKGTRGASAVQQPRAAWGEWPRPLSRGGLLSALGGWRRSAVGRFGSPRGFSGSRSWKLEIAREMFWEVSRFVAPRPSRTRARANTNPYGLGHKRQVAQQGPEAS